MIDPESHLSKNSVVRKTNYPKAQFSNVHLPKKQLPTCQMNSISCVSNMTTLQKTIWKGTEKRYHFKMQFFWLIKLKRC